jgi:hypothetical protein
MALAPYTNDRRTIGIDSKVLGQFREKEFDHSFEFAENDGWFADEYPHKIFVGNDETRIGLVKKTVAYVVVDEGDDGSPVVQKWSIKNFRGYE